MATFDSVASHVATIVPPLQAGWIWKLPSTSSVLKTWRRRWHVLERNCIMWHEQPGQASLGMLPIDAHTRLSRIEPPSSLSLSLRRTAIGRMPPRELCLRFASAQELESWWDTLSQVCTQDGESTPADAGDAHTTPSAPRSVRLITPGESSGAPQPRPPCALVISVRFLQTEARGGMTFATYELATTEGEREWKHAVRWSDLRRMHDDLERWHADELAQARRTTPEMPTFRAHGGINGVLRFGAAKLASDFCDARAVEMQQLLMALVVAFDVSLVRHEGPAVLRSFLAKGCDVTQPTPEERWYTPERGWPAVVVAWAGEERLAPCSLTPTGAAAAALPEETLGELRVEILQATGLVSADMFSYNDVYALLLYDGACAKTCVLEDAQHPRWQPDDARAARFAVVSPHAALYVGIFDADFSLIDDDEPLGRTVVEVRRLQPGTSYTAWFPLQMRTLRNARAKYGRVQLRYSVTWKKPRQRLLRHLAPPPKVELPLMSSAQHTAGQARQLIAFTRYGINPDSRYDWKILDEHIKELLSLLELVPHCVSAVENVLFWRAPLSSLTCCVLWQLICDDGALALSSLPLLLVAVLAHTYAAARAGAAIHHPPSVLSLLSGLVLGWLPALHYTPPAAAPDAAAPPQEAAPAVPALPDAPAQSVANVAAAALAMKRANGVAPSTGACPRAAASARPSPKLVQLVEREEHVRSRGNSAADSPRACAAAAPAAPAAPATPATPASAAGGAGPWPYASSQEATNPQAAASSEASSSSARPAAPERRTDRGSEEQQDDDPSPPPAAAPPKQARAAGESDSDEDEAEPPKQVRRPLREELQAKREAEMQRAAEMTEKLRRKARARKRARGGVMGMLRAGVEGGARAVVNFEVAEITVNPLAPVLGPIQRILGEQVLTQVRGVRALLAWEDPALTAWVCLALLLLAVVIPLLPWLWIMRLLGAALFGPHMYFVGRLYFKQKEEAERLERRYQAATNSEARAILREQAQIAANEEQQLTEKARAEAEAQEAKRSEAWREREAARRQQLDNAQESIDVSASYLINDKFPTRCDPLTSSARSLPRPHGKARRRPGSRRHGSSIMGFHSPSGGARSRETSSSASINGSEARPASSRKWTWETGCLDLV